jgi:hypothetical protein
MNQAISEMLGSACEPLTKDPRLVASVLQGIMAGVSRRVLESHAPEEEFGSLRQELIFCACAYLETCSAQSRASVNRSDSVHSAVVDPSFERQQRA